MTERREERSRGRRAAIEARRRQQRLRRIILGVVVLAIVAVGAFFIIRNLTKDDTRIKDGFATETDAGQLIPDMGSRDHVTGNVNYNSDPPTSGNHWVNPFPWGVMTDPAEDERQVHNLEHGGIVIQYNCDKTDDCQALVDQLTPLATQYTVKLLMAPRSGMKHMIALTAWNRLLTLDTFDQAAIQRFIDAYIDKGPENIPSETQTLEQERQSSGSP